MKALLFAFCSLFLSTLAHGEEHATGLIHPEIFAARAEYAAPIDVPLPATYDLRPLLSPVRDQGQCGSCWAFASTGALEGAIAVQQHRLVHLSEQEMVDCNGQGWGCQGGYFAHDMQVNPGQTGIADLAYTARNGWCPANLPPREKAASWKMIGAAGRAPTPDEIKAAIVQNGPVAVTVSADAAFQRYSGGVFRSCSNGETNHMVLLVGWTADGNWIMRNEWSDKWGDHGYMTLPFGCSRIGEEASTVFL